jgi:hypothetical protein
MAIVRFIQKEDTPSGAKQFEAEFIRVGGAPRRPQLTAAEVTTPKPGKKGFIPRGTENLTR